MFESARNGLKGAGDLDLGIAPDVLYDTRDFSAILEAALKKGRNCPTASICPVLTNTQRKQN